jgi:hypothetical protein
LNFLLFFKNDSEHGAVNQWYPHTHN